MKILFQPAVRLLDRLSYPLKFGLIILVCVVASVILLAQIFTSLREEIRVTQQEIAGLKLFDAGFAVTAWVTLTGMWVGASFTDWLVDRQGAASFRNLAAPSAP